MLYFMKEYQNLEELRKSEPMIVKELESEFVNSNTSRWAENKLLVYDDMPDYSSYKTDGIYSSMSRGSLYCKPSLIGYAYLEQALFDHNDGKTIHECSNCKIVETICRFDD